MTERNRQESNRERCMKLNQELNIAGEGILFSLLCKMEAMPDKVRDLIGSVDVRKLEVYGSLRKQRDAALEEWLNEDDGVIDG